MQMIAGAPHARAQAMAKAACRRLGTFARPAIPANESIPTCRPKRRARRATMLLDEACTVVDASDGERVSELWSKVATPPPEHP